MDKTTSFTRKPEEVKIKKFTSSNVRKYLNLTSGQRISRKSGMLIHYLMKSYLNEALKNSKMYADRQGKDVIDRECFAAVEEMLIQNFS